MGGPAMLNTHAHFEQPQPQKSFRSTHTNSRRIASMARLPIWCGYAFAKDGVALVVTATKEPLFAVP